MFHNLMLMAQALDVDYYPVVTTATSPSTAQCTITVSHGGAGGNTGLDVYASWKSGVGGSWSSDTLLCTAGNTSGTIGTAPSSTIYVRAVYDGETVYSNTYGPVDCT